MSDGYEVGYCKPPKHTRFQKGQSGNLKGRPKGHRDFKTDLRETLMAPVQLKEKGRQRTVSTQMAALYRLREKALGGDIRSLHQLLELARNYDAEELAVDAAATLAQDDQDLLDGYFERRSRSEGEPQGGGKVPRRRLNRLQRGDDHE